MHILENLIVKIQQLFPTENIIVENDGWCSYAFTVGDKIVRVPKSDIEVYEKEAKVLQFLKGRVSVEIPEVKVILDEDLSYAIHKKLEGKIWRLETFNQLSDAQKDLFCRDVAVFYAEMHQVQRFDTVDTVGELQGKEYLQDADIQKNLKNLFPPEEIEIIYQWVEENLRSDTDIVFCHKDFTPWNSLVDEDHRLKCVFDFCNAGLDSRYVDFSSLYWSDHMELLTCIIDHYERITGVKIDLQKLDNLDYDRSLSIISYLSSNPEIKKEKQNFWDKHVGMLKNLVRENR